ncbi:MAG: elongation factor P [Parcubacteria group bacterium]|nr:elongation factor P [Parcubacteria group bacterium]
MLTINDLRPGTFFVFEGEPYELLEMSHSKIAQRRAVLQSRIRNLRTGAVLQKNFSQGEKFEEAAIIKRPIQFVYVHRGEYVFCDAGNPKNRFSLPLSHLGDAAKYLKPNTELEAMEYEGKIFTVTVPIKMDLVVRDAPPGLRGDTAQGGTKTVTLETGATIQVPLFIQTGDVVRVNTRTHEYVERVAKA